MWTTLRENLSEGSARRNSTHCCKSYSPWHPRSIFTQFWTFHQHLRARFWWQFLDVTSRLLAKDKDDSWGKNTHATTALGTFETNKKTAKILMGYRWVFTVIHNGRRPTWVECDDSGCSSLSVRPIHEALKDGSYTKTFTDNNVSPVNECANRIWLWTQFASVYNFTHGEDRPGMLRTVAFAAVGWISRNLQISFREVLFT